MIKDDVKIGKGTKIFHPGLVNLYGCKIGQNCKIGAFVEIRKDVTIGNNVKVQAFAFIPEGVSIEDGAFIGPHVCFTNDKYPRSINRDGGLKQSQHWKITRTYIKKGASIGSNSTILCGITVGEYAMVGAGSVVTKNVAPNTIVAGNPAKPIRKIKR